MPYQDELRRLKTYDTYPNTAHVRPSVLAAAGFIYVGIEDMVKCIYCGGVLRHWQYGDDPKKEHMKYYQECHRRRTTTDDGWREKTAFYDY